MLQKLKAWWRELLSPKCQFCEAPVARYGEVCGSKDCIEKAEIMGMAP
jgi:hypothetical protein